MALMARRQISRPVALAIYDEAEGICALCTEWVPLQEMNIDHITPVNRGGTDRLSNLQLAHRRCNAHKTDLLPGETLKKNQPPQPRPVRAIEPGELTVPEAMRRYGVSRHVIRRLHEAGLLRLYKHIGERADLMMSDDLERALNQRRGPGRPRRVAPAPE